MGTSKVEYNGETLIDISGDTVTPDTLAEGATAHNSNGEQITGTAVFNDGDSGSASSFRVTAIANLTSATDGTLTDLSHSFEEIEAANTAGQCVVLDIDISQLNPGQRATLTLISYINNVVVLFGGSINTAMTGCMQMSAMLDAGGNALLFISTLATIEDIDNTTFKVTADYTPNIGTGGITITVANLSATFAEIKAAFDLGKDIKLVGKQTVGNTNDYMLFNFVTINDVQAIFSVTAFLNGAFLLIGFTLNADNSTDCIIKTI